MTQRKGMRGEDVITCYRRQEAENVFKLVIIVDKMKNNQTAYSAINTCIEKD